MFKIRTLNAISSVVHEILTPDRYTIADDIASPDALLVRSAKCLDMTFSKELRAIARAGAGVNNIPIERCTQEGIVVFNTPGANANAVKELVFASMMMASRNLYDAIDWCKSLQGKGDEIGSLVETGKKRFIGKELKGKTLGVIGLGAIGVLVANEGFAIGMNVVGYDPFISVEHAWKLSRSIHRVLSLDELVAQCDYISIHVPLTKDTRNYLSADTIYNIKRGATVLNFARGELVESEAMLNALEDGIVSKYIVDFPSEEMIDANNVICIPHLGASTPESEENCAVMAAEQLSDFLENGNIANSVNFPACELARMGEMRICIVNTNKPNMIGQFTALLSEKGANITNMLNKSRGSIAYTMFDLDETINNGIIEKLMQINGVIRVTTL